MKKLLSCAFNMDSGCVELKFNDGSMIAINCTAVENEVATICISGQSLTILSTMTRWRMPTSF
jgi:hypothetical protein